MRNCIAGLQHPLVAVVADAATAKALFLENERLHQLMTVRAVRGPEVEVASRPAALVQDMVEEGIQRTELLALGAGRDILSMDDDGGDIDHCPCHDAPIPDSRKEPYLRRLFKA